MAPLCLMWTIWRKENARCFKDMELTMVELSNRFLKLLFLWAGALNIPQVSNMQQFVKWIHLIILEKKIQNKKI